jgi:hypothetical protein
MKKLKDTGITFAIYAALIALVAIPSIGIWVFRSRMEANAYNRVTGSNVTTWEAMWIELRVQAGPQ